MNPLIPYPELPLPPTAARPTRAVRFTRVRHPFAVVGTVDVHESTDRDGFPLDRTTIRRYAVCEIPAGGVAHVRAFRFTKPGGSDHYVATTDDRDSRGDACECRGWLRHGRCTHLQVVNALADAGQLDELVPEPAGGNPPGIS